jgi:hypothetical protein
MKKIVRLTESDLVKIIKKVINEETAQPSKQTTKVLPNAENVAEFQNASTTFNRYGVSLQTILNSYRNGATEGVLIGRDKPYYWIVTIDGNSTRIEVNELYINGAISAAITATYNGKVWGDRDSREDNNSAFYASYREKQESLRPTAFWATLMKTSAKIKNSFELVGFLNACKKYNQPSNLKDMISKKTQLVPMDGVTSQDITSIKSSIPYTNLKV